MNPFSDKPIGESDRDRYPYQSHDYAREPQSAIKVTQSLRDRSPPCLAIPALWFGTRAFKSSWAQMISLIIGSGNGRGESQSGDVDYNDEADGYQILYMMPGNSSPQCKPKHDE